MIGAGVFVAAALVPAPDEIRVAPFDRYGEAVADGRVPYEDFSLEYPPGALPAIVVPALVPGVSYSTAFRAFEILFGLLLVGCTTYLLRDARPRDLILGVGLVSALPLLLGPMVVNRFDLYPALLVVASLVALDRTRDGLAGSMLGLAVAAKAYAGALVPPFGSYIEDVRGRRSAWRSLAVALIAAALVTIPLAVVAPGGVASSVLRQTGRELQIESVGASIVLAVSDPRVAFEGGSWSLVGTAPRVVALAATAAGLLALVAVWVAAFARRERLGDPVLCYAVVVAIVLVFAKVLSPQFLVWLAPLVALVRGRVGLAACGLLASACVLTRLVYPDRYEELLAREGLPVALLLLRNGLLVAIAVLLVLALARRLQGESVAQ